MIEIAKHSEQLIYYVKSKGNIFISDEKGRCTADGKEKYEIMKKYLMEIFYSVSEIDTSIGLP